MAQYLQPIDEIGSKIAGTKYSGGLTQKYFLTDRGRDILLTEYDGTYDVINDLAQRLKVPRHKIKMWASQLGLCRKKEPLWTEQEISYLEVHLRHQSLATIAATLGRTKTAVRLKAKRIGVNKSQEGYTMRGICEALGCDHHKVKIWFDRGWLYGERRGTERHGFHGDMWLFTDKDIRDFVLAHPLEIDQRRMDWLWMVDLLSNGIGSLAKKEVGEEAPKRERLAGEMNIDVENMLHFDSDSLAGKSIALLGITGSGKTNTAFVLLGEMLAAKTAMTIVDIEGEYWALAQQYSDMLVVGRSEHCTLEIGRGNAAEIAKASMENGTPVLIDLSDYSALESHVILVKYFGTLWMYSTKVKRSYRIVLEEAHEWLPESGTTDLKDVLSRIALRGRKRGLDLMVVSQRSAKVAKDVLTQASLLFLHKVVHPTDIAVYKSLIPLAGATVIQMVGRLQTGQAVVIYNNVPQVVKIRQQGDQPVQVDVKTVMRKRIKELEAQLEEQAILIADQANEIARLSERPPVQVEHFV